MPSLTGHSPDDHRHYQPTQPTTTVHLHGNDCHHGLRFRASWERRTREKKIITYHYVHLHKYRNNCYRVASAHASGKYNLLRERTQLINITNNIIATPQRLPTVAQLHVGRYLRRWEVPTSQRNQQAHHMSTGTFTTKKHCTYQ